MRVTIFGGIGSQLKHYRYAIEVYKAYNYNVKFYPAYAKGSSVFIPKLYENTVNQAKSEFKDHPLLEQEEASIIHATSGGIWSGLRFNSFIEHKAFVMEAGPFKLCNNEFINTIERVYKMQLPDFVHNNSETFMSALGVPTKKSNPEWFNHYENELSKLKNVLMVIGKKDEIVNHEFLREFFLNIKCEKQYYEMIEGTHHNLAKSNPKEYQEILENFIKTI